MKTDLTPYTDTILTRFSPTENVAEATHRFSTAEVREAIRELNPGIEASEADVYKAMTEVGFTFDSARGSQSLRFQWLLVEK